MPLCGYHLAADLSSVCPVSMALIFVPLSMKPTFCWCVYKLHHLVAFVMLC